MNSKIKFSLLVLVFSLLSFLVFQGELLAQGAPAKVIMTSAPKSQFMVGDRHIVTWTTENFPKGAFININLVKKVSDSPASYELVRQIASYTQNDGEESWTVLKGDLNKDLYLEVTCAGSARFKDGCVSSLNSPQFQVRTNLGNDVANALTSFLRALGIFD